MNHTERRKRTRKEQLQEEESKRQKTEENNESSFNEDDLDMFDNKYFVCSTQDHRESVRLLEDYENGRKNVGEHAQNNEGTDENSSEAKADSTLEEAKAKIVELNKERDSLQEENGVLTQKLKAKDEMNMILKGNNSEMESEITNLKQRLEKYVRVVPKMMSEIKELKRKDDKHGKAEAAEIKVKLEKSQDVVKTESKTIDDMEIKVNNLNIKLREEAGKRAKAEADNVRISKFCDHLQEALDKNVNKTTKKMEKVNEKCRNYENDRECKYGEDCRFIHTEKVCKYFALVGYCQLGKECKDSHPRRAWHLKLQQLKMYSVSSPRRLME